MRSLFTDYLSCRTLLLDSFPFCRDRLSSPLAALFGVIRTLVLRADDFFALALTDALDFDLLEVFFDPFF